MGSNSEIVLRLKGERAFDVDVGCFDPLRQIGTERSELAWRAFAWFVSEPDHIMVLHRGADADRALLSELMRG